MLPSGKDLRRDSTSLFLTRRQEGILEIYLNNTPNISPQGFSALVERTEGYSGADIGIVVQEAVMMPIRNI